MRSFRFVVGTEPCCISSIHKFRADSESETSLIDTNNNVLYNEGGIVYKLNSFHAGREMCRPMGSKVHC